MEHCFKPFVVIAANYGLRYSNHHKKNFFTTLLSSHLAKDNKMKIIETIKITALIFKLGIWVMAIIYIFSTGSEKMFTDPVYTLLVLVFFWLFFKDIEEIKG